MRTFKVILTLLGLAGIAVATSGCYTYPGDVSVGVGSDYGDYSAGYGYFPYGGYYYSPYYYDYYPYYYSGGFIRRTITVTDITAIPATEVIIPTAGIPATEVITITMAGIPADTPVGTDILADIRQATDTIKS
jgi:hypothetical protein